MRRIELHACSAPHYKGPDFNGLCVRHKPEDHNKVIARRCRGKKNCRSKGDLEKKVLKEDEVFKSQQRKLALSKEMKAALLAVSAFTEEYANVIANEM